jgi:hypothetical protein
MNPGKFLTHDINIFMFYKQPACPIYNAGMRHLLWRIGFDFLGNNN